MDAKLPHRDAAGSSGPLEQFRSRGKRLSIHPQEILLLWIVATHLVFLPWAIGGMRPWSQWISLALAALGFAVALLPRNYTSEHTGGPSHRALPYPRLLRFPIFWLGLALLALVVAQALNAAWELHSDGRYWWMHEIPHVAWLPSSVKVPFERWGPWRMLIIYASGWLTVCAIWVGFTRRRTIQRLVLTLSINGVALSFFGLAERMFGNGKIFWVLESENPSFFSSFVYKNHAGAYLNLVLAVTCGLAGWHYVRGVRRLEKSNPSGVFAFMATCIAVSVLVSYARGATLVMLVYLCLVVAAFVLHQVRLPKAARQPVIAVALLLVFGFFLKTGFEALHSEIAWDRLQQAVSGNDVSVEARETAAKAAFDMWRAHWALGTGSGSFGFLFTTYAQHYPSIWGVGFWRHAHNDILEIPIELGLPGVLLILAGFGYWALVLIRTYVWQNALSASVILGCLFMVGMAWGEFVFQNPAILITWCALWPIATLWAQLEERAAR